ncbi:hypothetical protein V8G54_001644 [Vigna mungo]|uniref:chitinase n=1 Tax=Vigna mungo TaxID=3915 RepID=A0AAQ3P7E6_VIGMU
MGNMKLCSLMVCLLPSMLMLGTTAQQCGWQAGGALCANRLCCSQYGWCGNNRDYCGTGCQSQCQPTSSGGGISSIISSSTFEEMLKHRNNQACPGRGFYTYEAFLDAARSFNGFGTTGDITTQKRELAAFFAQTSHETTGGWATAPDGPYAWGYCFINERNQDVYCSGGGWPCAPGKRYYGRGPIQLTHNYNYGLAGSELGLDLTNDPDLVGRDRNVAFRTAIWFWMRPQGNKPSCHNVITGGWTPSTADTSAGRVPGYGVITNIINGGLECGRGPDARVQSRIGFYERYCQLLGVSPGNNLDCYNQAPF